MQTDLDDGRPLIFGGQLTSDMSDLPGMLERLVTATRDYPKTVVECFGEDLAGSPGKTNGVALEDDTGKTWPPGSLMVLGANGRETDDGERIILVHKFAPLAVLYPPHPLPFLTAREPADFVPPEPTDAGGDPELDAWKERRKSR